MLEKHVLCLKSMFSAFGKLSLTSVETPIGLIPTYGQPEWVREHRLTGFDFLLELFELMLENRAFMLENYVFDV